MKRLLWTLCLALLMIPGILPGSASPACAQAGGVIFSLPDLVIGSTTSYYDAADGHFKLKVQIWNDGIVTSSTCQLRMVLDTGRYYQPSPIDPPIPLREISYKTVGPIAPTTYVYRTYDLGPSNPPGVSASLWIDSDNANVEILETNNTAIHIF